VFGHVIQG